MTTPLHDSATVRELLFGETLVEPTEALAKSLREHGTVKARVTGLPGLTSAVEQKVATEASALLSLNLGDMVVAGWKRSEALRDAARRTRNSPPTTEEIVKLVTHRIDANYPVTIEMLVDGKLAGTIDVKLTVGFDLAAVLAVVCQARLTAVRSGTCTVTGILTIEQGVVAQGKRGFDLPGAIQLRQGLALLDAAVA
jgi:hypothetical protein